MTTITDLEAEKLAGDYEDITYIHQGNIEDVRTLALKVKQLIERQRWTPFILGKWSPLDRSCILREREDGQCFVFQLPPLPQPPETRT